MTQETKGKLTDPLQPHEIEWKAQPQKGKGYTRLIPYTDNRAIMKRLDTFCKPENWRVSFEEYKDGAKCRLELRINSEWIWREDVATDTNIEATKGGVSSAMKRAAAQWGIGRELYDYPEIKIQGESWYVPYDKMETLKQLTLAFIKGEDKNGNPLKDSYDI